MISAMPTFSSLQPTRWQPSRLSAGNRARVVYWSSFSSLQLVQMCVWPFICAHLPKKLQPSPNNLFQPLYHRRSCRGVQTDAPLAVMLAETHAPAVLAQLYRDLCKC